MFICKTFEAFADIPQELAGKIVSYRKIRKRIFHIDELYRIGGISRKYFRRLASVFYVSNQVVPRIGAQLPYSNALSTVSVQQKHQKRNANLKKRKMKIKKCENQRKIEKKRDRKRELQREGISTQYKPLGKKCNLNSTNLKKLSTHNKLVENLGKKVQKKEGKIGKYRIVKRGKSTEIEQNSDQSSELVPSTRRANINETSERVVRLLAAIPKLEGDNKDMEEYNTRVDMEEDNIDMEEVLTYRKRPYRCVKRPETTDTVNSSDSSESIPSLASAIVQRANINERVARVLVTSPKLEVDDIDMKEDNINMEEVLTYRKRPYRCLKRPEITDTENSCDSSESIQSLASAIVQRANINKRAARLLSAIPKLEGDSIELEENNVEMEEDNIHTYRKRPYRCVNRPETTYTEQRSESSESAPPTRRLNINERVARLLGAVHKFECDDIDMEEDKVDMEEDNIDMEEENIPTCSKRPKYSSDSSGYSGDSSECSNNSSEYSNNSSEYISYSSQYSSNSLVYSSNSSESSSNSLVYSSNSLVYSGDSSESSNKSSESSSNSSEYISNSSEYISNSSEYSSDSSKSIQSVVVQRGNINERVAKLLATVPTLEGDNMEMEEDNSLTNRKREYQSVKRQETTDTDQRSKHSVSIPASVIEQEYNDAMEIVARWMLAIPEFESDTMEMEEDYIEMEKENIRPGHV